MPRAKSEGQSAARQSTRDRKRAIARSKEALNRASLLEVESLRQEAATEAVYELGRQTSLLSALFNGQFNRRPSEALCEGFRAEISDLLYRVQFALAEEYDAHQEGAGSSTRSKTEAYERALARRQARFNLIDKGR